MHLGGEHQLNSAKCSQPQTMPVRPASIQPDRTSGTQDLVNRNGREEAPRGENHPVAIGHTMDLCQTNSTDDSGCGLSCVLLKSQKIMTPPASQLLALPLFVTRDLQSLKKLFLRDHRRTNKVL
jgi:hypothetical protein